jgi:hypothetical protein
MRRELEPVIEGGWQAARLSAHLLPLNSRRNFEAAQSPERETPLLQSRSA